MPLFFTFCFKLRSGLPFCMPHLHLPHDFLERAIFPWQQELQHVSDVVGTQQWLLIAMDDPRLQNEQESHHAHRNVMVPRQPSAHLVLIHTDRAFPVLEGAFNPESLRLHASETPHVDIIMRIADRIFYVAGAANTSPASAPELGSSTHPITDTLIPANRESNFPRCCKPSQPHSVPKRRVEAAPYS